MLKGKDADLIRSKAQRVHKVSLPYSVKVVPLCCTLVRHVQYISQATLMLYISKALVRQHRVSI